MSVKLRKYQGGDDWEVDIRVQLPDGSVVRERKKAPVTGRTAVLRWAEARERVLVVKGKPPRKKVEVKPVPTLAEFSNRFLEGYAKSESTEAGWGVIDRVPCSIKLLRTPKSVAAFYDSPEFKDTST